MGVVVRAADSGMDGLPGSYRFIVTLDTELLDSGDPRRCRTQGGALQMPFVGAVSSLTSYS